MKSVDWLWFNFVIPFTKLSLIFVSVVIVLITILSV